MLIKILTNILKQFLFYKYKNKIDDFSELRNIHKGQECYIFGDGISLKYFDLSVFNDKIGIATNNLIFHKDFNRLNIKYYSIYEPYWFFPFFVSGFKGVKIWKNNIQNYHKIEAKKNKQIKFFTDISNAVNFKGKNIYYVSDRILNYITEKKFISHKINSFEGSLRVQITLAIFLGFKKVFLVGHDYTHEESFKGHFYEKGYIKKNKLNKWNNDFLEKAKKEINLITITQKGGAPSLDSISYSDFCNKKLNYKENHEIVSENELLVLKSWPYYKI